MARCNLQGMALYFSAMADARIRPIRIPLHAPWEWYHMACTCSSGVSRVAEVTVHAIMGLALHVR